MPWAAVEAPADQLRSEATLVESVREEDRELREDNSSIDAESVGHMRDELGLDLWTAVVDVYLPQSDTLLADCRAAIFSQDAVARRNAAQSLKGSSAGLRFNSIASLADLLQRCEPSEAAVTLEKFEMVYSQTRFHRSIPIGGASSQT